MSVVLVVDDDVDIARFIEINLRLEGFEVRVAHDGEAAEESIEEVLPDLVLLDVMMPKVDGVELCRRLRANPVTANLPVIMLTAKSLSADKVVGLTAGADDYIIKPFDTLELVARVRSTLRRTAEMRAVSPLTGLPGNRRIDEEILARSGRGEDFAVSYVDLDNFKAYNDRYGFLRGDEVISLLADALQHAAAEVGEPPPFIGHIGGDDFVVVSGIDQSEPLARQVVKIVDEAAASLHDPEDAARGYIALPDRQGNVRQFPVVSVSIGIALSTQADNLDHRAIVATATDMKKVAKRTVGSSIAVDRRG